VKILLLVLLLTVSCIPDKMNKPLNHKGSTRIEEVCHVNWQGHRVCKDVYQYVIDGCEYLHYDGYEDSFIHKGNCKNHQKDS
jgi:hypothetical protein